MGGEAFDKALLLLSEVVLGADVLVDCCEWLRVPANSSHGSEDHFSVVLFAAMG
jgi:hypothetical protein